MSGPPDDAYGRVTNPKRYTVVQRAARTLLDELVSSFNVELVAGGGSDPGLIQRSPGVVIEDVVRLVPLDPAAAAAPVTFAFTAFPGVLVHAGEWRVGAYPRCGCDACDEEPVDVVEQLRNDIEAVTAGGLVEKWDGTRLHSAIVYSDGPTASGWTLIEQDRPMYGPPGEYRWRPWPPAVPQSLTAD